MSPRYGHSRRFALIAIVLLVLGIRAGESSDGETGPSQPYRPVDVYLDLRDGVLALASSQALGSRTAKLVLMEVGYPEVAMTLVAAHDGMASIYLSSGGGVIGAGEHPEVREEALTLLALAARRLAAAEIVTRYPLPQRGRVRFYLIGSDGVRTAEAARDELADDRHALSALFHQGHRVIAAIRQRSSR